MNDVSPAQRSVCAELMNRTTRMSHEESLMLLDAVAALMDGGEQGNTILHWLSLLPRARGKAEALRLEPVARTPLAPSVVHALRPVVGEDKTRSIKRLLDPDAYAPKIRECVECGTTFDAGYRPGRPAERCSVHKRKPKKRAA